MKVRGNGHFVSDDYGENSFYVASTSRYFCSHCRANFDTAAGQLSFQRHTASAELTLANDEIRLASPFSFKGALSFDSQLAGDSAISFHKDNSAQTITSFETIMTFFGPNAENAGLLFSLHQEGGHLTGAAVGHRE